MFQIDSIGIQTHRDSLCIDETEEKLAIKMNDFFENKYSDLEIKLKYEINENKEWSLKEKRVGIFDRNKIKKINYRPFDTRYIYFDGKVADRLREKINKHILGKINISLIIARQAVSDWQYVFLSNHVIESNLTGTAGRFGAGNAFPLYLYPESSGQLNLGSSETRTPNLNLEIVDQIATGLGLTFVPEKGEEGEVCFAESDEVMPEYRQTFAPIDLLDYIYAVLHSPSYRETYKEFLKIDFPRVPYPTDVEEFWRLVALGGELRSLHLMESPSLSDYITEYPIGGENEVEKPHFVIAREERPKQSVSDEETASVKNLAVMGRVHINSEQYFDKVPELAWNFYIGGYQPAQKWLKDRKGRTLDFGDILHYQKIIKALVETDRVMREIDGEGN